MSTESQRWNGFLDCFGF